MSDLIARNALIGGGKPRLVRPDSAVGEYAQHLVDDVAITGFRQGLFTLFDPERPAEDANAVLAEQRKNPQDPRSMKHHCPMCCHSVTAAGCEAEAMEWAVFRAHLRKCFISNRLTKLDITKRKFGGGSLADAQTGGLRAGL